MSILSAVPKLSIQIYPYEGSGSPGLLLEIDSSNGLLLSASVQKSIRGSEPGTFRLTLAPGGPDGVASAYTWAEILTPMSLVIITGERGVFSGPLMVGVIHSATETQAWEAEEGVSRVTEVVGYDFQYFFSQRSYYTLTFLGSSAAAALETTYHSLSLPAILGKGLLGGSPASVGASWFEHVMAGKDGILSKTQFYYKGGYITFTEAMTQAYDNYPTANVLIPMAENFLSTEGTWYDKFTRIFPMPFYEFFVITAPQGAYAVNAASVSNAADTFTVPSIKGPSGAAVPFGPTLVARVNPLPRTVYANGKYTMDTSRWKNLPLYSLGRDGETEYGFIDSAIQFDAAEARNFYLIVPTTIYTMIGKGAGINSPYVFTMQAMADVASIRRYGYRPQITNTYWLADVDGKVSQANTATAGSFDGFISDLMSRITSYYEPAPLMGHGEVRSIFRPDIIPGNRFTYAPFRNGEEWEFYIEAISHEYVFGGQSTTTLTLTRGLPKTIYEEATPGLLTDIHIGNAQRLRGRYVQGLPSAMGPPLAVVTPHDVGSLLGEISQDFTTAQRNG